MIKALAPIDGYTDCAFREIVKKYSKPDLVFTEFVNALGLMRAPDKLVDILRFTENQRTVIAQLFGREPDYFYAASIMCMELGFDGIDINMGCPAKNIASKGGGAALINEPKRALRIIKAVKQAGKDFVEADRREFSNIISDKSASELKIDKLRVQSIIKKKKRDWSIASIDENITISVKTRTGVEEPMTEKWIRTLAKAEPDFISLHGRTFKQRYEGKADWNEIAKAAACTDMPVIGNGDVLDIEEANRRVAESKCAGVMIARGSFGRPWVFGDADKFDGKKEKIAEVMFEHAKLYKLYKGEQRMFEFRKHLMAYLKGFRNAKRYRKTAAKVEMLSDVEEIVKDMKNS